MTKRVKAWQCIGCGRVEAPQTCIGVCQDRKVELVYAFDHEEALGDLELARQRENTLAALVRLLASTTPREGEWERSYRALQEQARHTLTALASDVPQLDGATDVAAVRAA